jgi:hypothetical protein
MRKRAITGPNPLVDQRSIAREYTAVGIILRQRELAFIKTM